MRGRITTGFPIRLGALALAVLAFAVHPACERSPAPPTGAGGPGAELRVPPAVPQRTTRGDLALRNLSDRIDVLVQRVGRASSRLADREQCVGLLLLRAQFTGSFSDFDRAIDIAEAALRDEPNHPRGLVLRARTASAVHRFEDAVKDLESAARLGADVDTMLASIRIAQGRELEAARAFARAQVERVASLEHLALLANAEAALGEFEAADRHYAAALATLRDPSPFPVAQLCFQRGVMWAEQGSDRERALPHYVEAVRRLPAYVAANVHLAELEAELGRRDAAIERLRPIADHSADPEPAGLLGELLVAKDANDPTGSALIERARGSYGALLARHRSAFLDHASEFFAGPGGDAALATRLAQENLELRQTPRAHELAIEAAFGARDERLGCQLVERARPITGRSRNLAELLEGQRGRCAQR